MGIGRAVNADGAMFIPGALDPFHNLAFMVGLAKINVQPQSGRGVAAQIFDIMQGLVAVYIRLTRAQHVQVGPINDENGLGCHDDCRRKAALLPGLNPALFPVRLQECQPALCRHLKTEGSVQGDHLFVKAFLNPSA